MTHNNKDKSPQTRLWTPVFVGIVIMTLCCYIVGQGLNAGTSVYLSYRGASATLAGIGAAVFSGAAAISRIICGPAADRRGRIVVATIGAVVLVVATVGAAAFPSLDLFVLWRLLQGAGFAAITTSCATAAADVLPIERLGEGIGYYGLGQAIAMSIGPALAIFLVGTGSPENLFWGLSVSAGAVFLTSFFCHYENNLDRIPETSTYRQLALQRQAKAHEAEGDGGEPGTEDDASASDGAPGTANNRRDPEGARSKHGVLDGIFEPKALAGALPMTVICPTFGFGIFFTGLYGTSIGIANPGMFFTVSAIAMIAIRISSRSFMDRTPAFKLHVVAAAAGLAYCAMLATVGFLGGDSPIRNILFYFAGIPYGLCLGMALPVNQAVSVKNSPAERWGAVNGLFFLLNDIGIGGAAILWGMSNDMLGFTTTLAFVAVFIVASVGVAWLTYPASEKKLR